MKPGVARLTFVVIVLGLSGVINMEKDALAFLYIDRDSLVMTLATCCSRRWCLA